MQVLAIVLMGAVQFGLYKSTLPFSIGVMLGFLAGFVPLGFIFTFVK